MEEEEDTKKNLGVNGDGGGVFLISPACKQNWGVGMAKHCRCGSNMGEG